MTIPIAVATDKRVQMTNTKAAPFRWICNIYTDWTPGHGGIPNSDGATGWLAGPRLVVTAGHVVNHVTTSATIIPGCNGVDARRAPVAPFGMMVSTILLQPRAFRVPENDFGFIVLPKSFGEHFGFFNVVAFKDKELVPDHHGVNAIGYPISKPSGTLWADANIIQSVDPQIVWSLTQSTFGDSGCPLFFRHLPPISEIGLDDDKKLSSTVVGVDSGHKREDATAYARITAETIGYINQLNASPDVIPSGLKRSDDRS